MKLIIEIPDDRYKILVNPYQYNEALCDELKTIVRNGTPLPKGHGKIVDIGKIDEDRIDHDNPIIYLTVNGEYIEAINLDYLDSLPTIIEAESEE